MSQAPGGVLSAALWPTLACLNSQLHMAAMAFMKRCERLAKGIGLYSFYPTLTTPPHPPVMHATCAIESAQASLSSWLHAQRRPPRQGSMHTGGLTRADIPTIDGDRPSFTEQVNGSPPTLHKSTCMQLALGVCPGTVFSLGVKSTVLGTGPGFFCIAVAFSGFCMTHILMHAQHHLQGELGLPIACRASGLAPSTCL